MELITRRQHKIMQIHHSLMQVMPADYVREYGLKKGDPMVSYQLNGLLVLVPLAYLGMIGEPRLVKLLRESQEL